MTTWRSTLHRFSEESGATLAEFAFSLPFLVVILYAIFDFGGALTLKQKLGASVYEAARAAAGQSTGDLSSPTVAANGSISDIRDAVAHHLEAAGVDDCGLLGAALTTNTNFTWVFNVSGGACPAPLILTINRQQVVPVAANGVTTHVIYTQVRLEYPYQWRLSKVIQLLVPSGTFPSSAIIAVEATMQNLT
jgi:Flp pilus assembly protein TadG